MKVVTAEEMRHIERASDAAGHTYAMMMEQAGAAVARTVQEAMAGPDSAVLVLVGPGNNGGDGLVTARNLHDAGARVTVYTWRRDTPEDPNFQAVVERHIPLQTAEEDPNFGHLRAKLAGTEIVVDGLLGTGASRPIEGLLKELLDVFRQVRREDSLIVAIDLPTGLNTDTGAVDTATVPADITVTFAYPKRGFYLFPGAEYIGELVVADIGTDPALGVDLKVEVATPESIAALLPKRPASAHKGTFGKALLVAGSVNYVGAAYLAGAAATRVGTGLVTMAIPRAIQSMVAARLTEATYLLLPQDMGVLAPGATRLVHEKLKDYEALLLGCGLTQEEPTVEFVHQLLRVKSKTARARQIGFRKAETRPADEKALEFPPMIIDADGLNALAKVPEWWQSLQVKAVLTPHPGEMARLLDGTIGDVEADRIGSAQQAAEKWNQVVVLKGPYTVIAAPDGRASINPFANPALATAGSGDVLAGAIAGFLAQGLAPFEAAVAGAYVHGLAGDLARSELGDAGVVAGDLVPRLPLAIKQIKGL
ncbi:MAG: hypothetical protein A2Z04_02080 [Chloroflexi bacterium RBG_16_57_9]|nr:MAG: hypothetical protein A2Z04_02080 [Chloroflexi bacterium RBG_16_57_9]